MSSSIQKTTSIFALLVIAIAYAAPAKYCPAAGDLIPAYTTGGLNVKLFNGGWAISGGGAAATKAAFNLLDGYVEYDVDFSATQVGVNANIYSISPHLAGSAFAQSDYCDGARPAGPEWCAEVDWIETNGNCGGASALHTVPGQFSGPGCTAWGCSNQYHYRSPKFHMRVAFDANGTWTTTHDGVVIQPITLQPPPQGSDWAILAAAYTTRGAVIYSSQWVGWVPVPECGSGGNLAASTFAITNLVVFGSVVQGPTPTLCSS